MGCVYGAGYISGNDLGAAHLARCQAGTMSDFTDAQIMLGRQLYLNLVESFDAASKGMPISFSYGQLDLDERLRDSWEVYAISSQINRAALAIETYDCEQRQSFAGKAMEYLGKMTATPAASP